MSNAGQSDLERSRIMLGLLEALEQDRPQSQRRLASELGIALGLVNAYLKRCVKKGLVKVREAPARRYAYYLTPLGFAEKSRLTVEYLSYSFSIFRQAKADYSSLLRTAEDRGLRRLVCAGCSDLTEIAALCALEHDIEIVGIVDSRSEGARVAGHAVVRDYDAVGQPFDAVLLTDLMTAREICEAAVARFGAHRVLVPQLLRLRVGEPQEAGS